MSNRTLTLWLLAIIALSASARANGLLRECTDERHRRIIGWVYTPDPSLDTVGVSTVHSHLLQSPPGLLDNRLGTLDELAQRAAPALWTSGANGDVPTWHPADRLPEGAPRCSSRDRTITPCESLEERGWRAQWRASYIEAARLVSRPQPSCDSIEIDSPRADVIAQLRSFCHARQGDKGALCQQLLQRSSRSLEGSPEQPSALGRLVCEELRSVQESLRATLETDVHSGANSATADGADFVTPQLQYAAGVYPLLTLRVDYAALLDSVLHCGARACTQQSCGRLPYGSVTDGVIYYRQRPGRSRTKVVFRYFLYFPRDEGIGSHAHDLEVAEVELEFCSAGGTISAEISRVTGFAHDEPWWYNVLDGTRSAHLRSPPHLFVEQGKHGLCPDADQNGIYIPAIDTNHHTLDNLGPRDDLSSGQFLYVSYSAEMTNRRTKEHRLCPIGHLDWCESDGSNRSLLVRPARHACRASQCAADSEFEAEVSCATSSSTTPALGLCNRQSVVCNRRAQTDEDRKRIARYSRRHGFAPGDRDVEFSAHGPALERCRGGFCVRAGAAIRFRTSTGQMPADTHLTFGGISVPYIPGWLLPGTYIDHRGFQGVNVMLVPSSARAYQWYAGIGLEDLPRSNAEEATLVWEAGFRFRVPLGPLGLRQLGAFHLGLGLRFSDAGGRDATSLAAELGIGRF